MLELVNNSLELYSETIGFGIYFGIDMETANKDFFAIIRKKGQNIAYEDLSGGEQQLVDISIAFAIHDVVGMEKVFNLLILDEVFESLDTTNVELVSELISLKAKNKSVYLITHLRDFSSSNSSVIQVKNKKGKGTILV
jgi:DNA repair exonuclease SbcCD ATPase subunit